MDFYSLSNLSDKKDLSMSRSRTPEGDVQWVGLDGFHPTLWSIEDIVKHNLESLVISDDIRQRQIFHVHHRCFSATVSTLDNDEVLTEGEISLRIIQLAEEST